MKTSRIRVVALAVCVLLMTGLGYHVFSADDKDVTLRGVGVWSGKRATVKAVLTPTGEKEYSVVYTFKWNERDETWHGTMKGNLRSGNVTGTGAPANKARTFVFRVRAVRGVMTGKHYETTRGTPKLTGDLRLRS